MYCPISNQWFDGFPGDNADNMTVCRSDCDSCLTYISIQSHFDLSEDDI